MSHLFTALAAITLLALSLLAMVDYVDPQAEFASDWGERLERDIVAFQGDFDDYLADHGDLPPDSLDPVVPEYGFLPVAPARLDWSYARPASDEAYICVSGTAGDAQRRTLEVLDAFLADARLQLDATCGARAAGSFNDTGSGIEMAATYWLTGYDP